MSRRLLVVASLLALACDPMPATNDGGVGSTAVLRFAPTTGAIDFGVMPFPDDLYLEDGHVELGALPAEDAAFNDYTDSARLAFRDLDGFGATTPVFFPVDGSVDPASLPTTAQASTLDSAAAFLIDVDAASPDAGTRVPVDVRWDAARQLLVLRPWTGHPLHEGRTYAAVVTRDVLGVDGLPLSSAPRFAAIRDAGTRPSDPLDAEVWDEISPVLPLLGVPTGEVAGLAVFTVQSISAGLADARAVVRTAPPPPPMILRVATGAALDELLGTPATDEPGLDVSGGVQHTHIGTVIDGTFGSPNFLDETARVHGRFTYGTDGTLTVRRTDDVYFTLALPPGDTSDLRVVVFQHGLGSERSAMFAIADALCAEGWAVAAIDIPYHGMRAAADPTVADMRHRFGTATGPDLYGEIGGGTVYNEFVGAGDTLGELSAFHPFYVRDVLRQSVVDLMSLVHQLDDGDWSGVETAGGPATLGFSSEPIGFVGVSLGGIVGTMFVTSEPRVGASVLNVTGGTLTALVAGSASFNGTFLPILAPRVGVALDTIDYATLPPEMLPELAIYQTLLDAGDSMAYGPLLRTREQHVLFQMAFDDETVPNTATEGLARATGVPIADGTPRYTDLSEASLPLAGNVTLPTGAFTRGLVVYDPATHGLLSQRSDEAVHVHPVVFPFEELPSPTAVTNPVADAVGQAAHFFATWETGVAEIVAP